MDKDDIKLLTEIEQRSKSNAHRLDEHEKKIEDLEKTYNRLHFLRNSRLLLI